MHLSRLCNAYCFVRMVAAGAAAKITDEIFRNAALSTAYISGAFSNSVS